VSLKLDNTYGGEFYDLLALRPIIRPRACEVLWPEGSSHIRWPMIGSPLDAFSFQENTR